MAPADRYDPAELSPCAAAGKALREFVAAIPDFCRWCRQRLVWRNGAWQHEGPPCARYLDWVETMRHG
jgi:hypothetical protein